MSFANCCKQVRQISLKILVQDAQKVILRDNRFWAVYNYYEAIAL